MEEESNEKFKTKTVNINMYDLSQNLIHTVNVLNLHIQFKNIYIYINGVSVEEDIGQLFASHPSATK